VSDTPTLTRKDFVSDQTVRWCPGCGDYAILAQMQKILPDIGVKKEDIVFISGIGCSSRFPYYMNTYGMHSIHGRAPTIATGLKIANPDLSVWVITGDGDGLSIGANHLLHALRRNVDINIILFNNRIYGLTKGQYSPTSLPGAVTKSSPMGSLEQSFNALTVAIGAESAFVARTIDSNVSHMADILKRAAEHKGTSFVEILQNCVIFNDGAWEFVTDKSIKDDNTLPLEHGKPMIFGKNQDMGIVMDGLDPKVVKLGEGYTEADLLVHDETRESASLAYQLSRMEFPDFPTPVGVFRSIDKPVYEEGVMAQIQAAVAKRGEGNLHGLYNNADTWQVAEEKRMTQTTGVVTAELDEEYIDTIDNDLTELTEVQHGLTTDPLSELIAFKPISVTTSASIGESIQVMQDKKIGALLVTDEDGKLAGIFTEWDVLRRVAGLMTDLSSAEIGDFMTSNPSTLKGDQPIANALHLMSLHHFRHVPIVDDDNKPVGIISFRDVVNFIEKYM
jgi:2-oxoglutarate ferredoxin oxidoreductase subunit beta